MTQERLNGLATSSENCNIARKLDFTTIIHDFANRKSRKLFIDPY